MVYHYLRRADIISGIGQFGGLFLGMDDGKSPDKEVPDGNHTLLYMRPFAQDSLTIKEWERDTSNPRYGLPKTYTLNVIDLNTSPVSGTASSKGKAITIHWSRMIHIAEGLKDNDVYGMPRLKRVLNRLEDMDRVVGGSSEMFWRGAFPGYNFKLDPEADPETQDVDDAKEQIENYVHKFQRYLRLQGIDVQTIDQQLSSPKDNFEVLISVISAVTRIPKRKFLGSERGELASGQDDENWNDYIHDRRANYIEPFVLRVFIDRMIKYGVLPKPELGYDVKWKDLNTLSDKDRAEVSRTKTEALVKYTAAVGSDLIVPPGIFRRRFLEMTQDDVEAADEEVQKLIEEENKAIAEEEERLRREQERVDEGEPRADGNNPVPNPADPNSPPPSEEETNRTAGSRRRRTPPQSTE